MADRKSNGLLIDSSIWLEYFFDQSKANEVGRLLSRGPTHRFAVSEFTVGSLGVILGANDQDADFAVFVRRVLIEGGIRRLFLSASELLRVVDVMREYNLDFDDAYQYVAAKTRDLELVSFDDDFDDTDLDRLTPQDVLDERA
jgi:hypothetical protein